MPPTITRKQADDLMRALSSLATVPAEERELPTVLAHNAQRAQFEAERRFSVPLTFDQAGVRALSRLLLDLREAMLPNRLVRLLGAKVSFQFSLLVANSFGAFLGEAMRRRLGGEWRFVVFNSQKLVALYFDENNWVLPTYKAGKEFMNGGEDDVSFFYETVVQKRSPGGIRPLLTISSDDLQDPDHVRKLTEKLNAELHRRAAKQS